MKELWIKAFVIAAVIFVFMFIVVCLGTCYQKGYENALIDYYRDVYGVERTAKR